jgi:hypothetical protein
MNILRPRTQTREEGKKYKHEHVKTKSTKGMNTMRNCVHRNPHCHVSRCSTQPSISHNEGNEHKCEHLRIKNINRGEGNGDECEDLKTKTRIRGRQ